jgi:tRNA threonylcarbamoyladenosine biosynthesis protein TsaB
VLVLSLDTTTRAGSVAVVDGDRVLSETRGDPSRTHGERLPADIDRALSAAGVTLDAVELLAVVAGPGSFTGMRVGIAAIQGLAMATGRRVVPVSALDALAAAGAADDIPVAAWIDAQRGEVFAALYDSTGTRAIIAATSASAQRTLADWQDETSGAVRFIGDGAVRYADVIRAARGAAVDIRPAPPLAGLVGRIAAVSSDRAVLPHAVVPIYVRKSDAELARERARE